MEGLVLALPGAERHARRLCDGTGLTLAAYELRTFPDQELYLRIDSEVRGKAVVVVSSLDKPGEKFLQVAFAAATARDLGAQTVGLVAPYLAFMRQDARFAPGEGVTSVYFARMLSSAVDWLVTVDPHLHRISSLDGLYSIPTRIAHAADAIAQWIKDHVRAPLLVGPDAESRQWVAAVAERCGAPFCVLEKVRRGDRDVSISALEGDCRGKTPVLIDDIISTGRTMLEATKQVCAAGGRGAICIGIHAVFADSVQEALLAAGAVDVVTCNTIPHPTNQICVATEIAATTLLQLQS